MPLARHSFALLIAASAAAACAGGASPAEETAPVVPSRPLASVMNQRVVVAPVNSVREGDPLGWAASIPRQREWLRSLDGEITRELGERGLRTAWAFPPDLVQAYQRNQAMSPDPHRLSPAPLQGITRLSGKERVPDPLASQLRTLVAVHDARYVLLPLDVSFENAEAGEAGGRARLRLVLIDARTTELIWIGDVRSEPAPSLTPGVAVSLASRFADLIVAR
ncbi:MAG: hypothetical protein H0X64_10670 [Gemmatimonadaceae bacterium]|nr:hypothetical protein [Gemmatimonadaceae bacterium]